MIRQNMLGWLRPKTDILLHPEFVVARDLASGQEILEEAIVVVTNTPETRILGIGLAAKPHLYKVGVRQIYPFKHPRTLIADIRLGEAVIRSSLRKLFANRLVLPAPHVNVKPMLVPDDGLAPIEQRALVEMILGAGAVHVEIDLTCASDVALIEQYRKALLRLAP